MCVFMNHIVAETIFQTWDSRARYSPQIKINAKFYAEGKLLFMFWGRDKMTALLQMAFSKSYFVWKWLCFWFKFHCALLSNWQCIGVDNGLVPNRRQAITWTNVDQATWRHKGLPGGCFTNVSRALQNNLCTCAQSMADAHAYVRSFSLKFSQHFCNTHIPREYFEELLKC